MTIAYQYSTKATAQFEEIHGFSPDQASGLRFLNRSRGDNILVGTYEAEAAGVAEDDKFSWAIICEVHGVIELHTALSEARYAASNPTEWCDECAAAKVAAEAPKPKRRPKGTSEGKRTPKRTPKSSPAKELASA